MKRILIALLLLAPGVQAFAGPTSGEPQLPVVGLGADGKPATHYVSAKEYERHLKALTKAFHESVQPVLNARTPKQKWMLRTVALGLAVSFEAGLGPIISASIEPKFRVLYSNKTETIVPDLGN